MKNKISSILGAIVIAIFVFGYASASTPVRIMPFEGGCTVDDITPGTNTRSTWTATGFGVKAVMFQNRTDVDVYIGFAITTSSQTLAVALYNKGDTLSLNISENQTVYFWGDGANADMRALYCK